MGGPCGSEALAGAVDVVPLAKPRIRRAFANILTRHKVDLVLTGHEHQYERFRIADVNYVISGGGGGQLTHFWGRSRALKQATVHHFLSFEVTAVGA